MLRLAVLAALAALTASPAGSAAGTPLQLTPVGRLPFPQRGFVVDLPTDATLDRANLEVRENGRPVRELDVAPVGAAGIRYGVVLALDTSESMTGAPLQAALAAAREFIRQRDPSQEIGIVTFNGGVQVQKRPSTNSKQLAAVLSRPPRVAYGTHIYDALDRSLELLAGQRVSAGAIVILSDGADVGSRVRAESVIAKAHARHVRIFSVGLRSGAFQPTPLRRLAEATGASFAQANSAKDLGAIYTALGEQFAREYLVQYRSDAAPRAHVDVRVFVDGVGEANAAYIAPTPTGVAPFHRPLLQRFLLSAGALLAVSLLVATLVAISIRMLLRPRGATVVSRVEEFSGKTEWQSPLTAEGSAARVTRRAVHGWLAKLDRQLEIGRIDIPAWKVALATAGGTVLAMIVLGLLAAPFAILGLLTPLITRTLIRRKLKQIRTAFADQLSPNLQVLASALRVGHSFIGALGVVADNAHEPSRSELQRVVADEQLGVPVETVLRRVAVRMECRDLEQVALLAELQRTAGGNAAEVLDTVVETIRERADLRRLMRTLTAQGRLARWILSALPVVVGAALWLLQGDAMRPLFENSGGQVAVVVAALMVIAGSLIIQRIVEIEV